MTNLPTQHLIPIAPPDTSERILAAAKEVFLHKGFRSATVREIASRARANIASIHYHFLDKETLYLTVLETFITQLFSRFPADMGQAEAETPEERLQAFVRASLFRLFLGPETPEERAMIRLAVQEFSSPAANLPPLIKRRIRPMQELLESVVKDLLAPAPDKESVALCAASIHGQCMHYAQHPRPFGNPTPFSRPSREEVQCLADHISHFSLHGIRGILARRRQEPSPRPPRSADIAVG